MVGEVVRRLQMLTRLMPVPDLSAMWCRPRLLEIFVTSIADMLAENGKQRQATYPVTHAHQADVRARGEMAVLSVPSLTSDVGAGSAAEVDDSYVWYRPCRPCM